MERRSTNDLGYVHHQGDIVSNVGSSHGVRLLGGSTGGIVESFGDDTNISLTVRAKNTATLILGSTGNPVFVAGSTAPWQGFIRATDTAVATPNFDSTNAMVMETTHVITGVTSSHFIIPNPRNLSTDAALLYAYAASTAGDVHCRFLKASTLTVAASTATIDFLAIRF